MLKSAKQTFNISPVGAIFYFENASGWGNVKNFFENVLLAGEMLKSTKQTFNISPVGAIFFLKMLLAGEMLKVFFFFFFFRKCASGWGNSKKVKNVKSGRNYVCATLDSQT